MAKRPADLSGQRFGRLVAIAYDSGRHEWRCRCDCGSETFVHVHALRSGKQVSCGCFRRSRPAHNRTHNRTLTTEYRTWRAMKRRCLNPNASQFAYYGGRGITICQRWIDSFEAFLADMGPKPSPKHTLDRHPDPNGPYEPGNCRWATQSEQVTNSRTALRLTHAGITDTAAGWGRRLGMKATVICGRLFHGWSVERALTEPIHYRGQDHRHSARS